MLAVQGKTVHRVELPADAVAIVKMFAGSLAEPFNRP